MLPGRSAPPMSLERRLLTRLAELEGAGLGRRLPRIDHRHGAHYEVDGRAVVGFCSNDYLGFAVDEAAHSVANGASASRLISGDLPAHRALEHALATWVGADDCVLFPSGFQLNVGVLSSLVAPDDLVYSDALNHASLIDGLRLARGTIERLPHGAPPPEPISSSGLVWWVCESLYSMDGDFTDPDAVRTFLSHGHHVYVDEAHALGLYSGGAGFLQAHGVRPTVLVGTLGKAFGASGAFAAASPTVCHWIRTRARSFVYSTGPSPAMLSTIATILPRVSGSEGDDRRDRLWRNVQRFSDNLGIARPRLSPIFPFVVGSNDRAMTLTAVLLDAGFHVQAIRPPTVPDGTSRLRLTVSALHTFDQIDHLCENITALFRSAGLEPSACLPSLGPTSDR